MRQSALKKSDSPQVRAKRRGSFGWPRIHRAIVGKGAEALPIELAQAAERLLVEGRNGKGRM